MTPEQWLQKADSFLLEAPDALRMGTFGAVYLKRTSFEKNTWAVIMDERGLGKDGQWHYLPSPSNMTEKLRRKTRWQSREEAYEFWCQWRVQHPDLRVRA